MFSWVLDTPLHYPKVLLTLLARIGFTFKSNIDFMMDRTEKMMESMGMDGKHATLPRT